MYSRVKGRWVEPRALLHALRHYALRTKITLADFNLAVSTPTTKLPNLIPRQLFRLYGMYFTLFCISNLSVQLWFTYHMEWVSSMCRVATRTVLLWTTVDSCLAGETILMDSWGWGGRRAPSLCEGGREGGREGGSREKGRRRGREERKGREEEKKERWEDGRKDVREGGQKGGRKGEERREEEKKERWEEGRKDGRERTRREGS